eukprot:2451407-Amphidinium_carterae.1
MGPSREDSQVAQHVNRNSHAMNVTFQCVRYMNDHETRERRAEGPHSQLKARGHKVAHQIRHESEEVNHKRTDVKPNALGSTIASLGLAHINPRRQGAAANSAVRAP